ncbi:MAG: hypothetical protein WD887_02615 [Candidatus Saccharimonadales bacterium]
MAEIAESSPNFEKTSLKKYKVELVSDPDIVRRALELEQKVWDNNDYGSLDVYEKYIPQSRIFGAFNRQDECIGVTRIFAGGPEMPPFMELPTYRQATKEVLMNECRTGQAEELGTVAVDKSAPAIEVVLGLWRAAYRDATSRNIKTWGIIMEPPRVKIMEKRYGFTFRQIGPEVVYQGGMCAAHVLDLKEVDAHMREIQPDYYDWFVDQPLDS